MPIQMKIQQSATVAYQILEFSKRLVRLDSTKQDYCKISSVLAAEIPYICILGAHRLLSQGKV
jgi:hypothetical protein